MLSKDESLDRDSLSIIAVYYITMGVPPPPPHFLLLLLLSAAFVSIENSKKRGRDIP